MDFVTFTIWYALSSISDSRANEGYQEGGKGCLLGGVMHTDAIFRHLEEGQVVQQEGWKGTIGLMSKRGEDQEVTEGIANVSVRRRTSTAKRCDMDGNAQNLKSISIDWGSSTRLERWETEAAKSRPLF
jgi:hypothetical protein